MTQSPTIPENAETAAQGSGKAAGKTYHAPENARDMWRDEKQPWASNSGGRLIIRSFSRAVMGAAFYAWGGHKASGDMKNYDPNNPQGVLQHVAKFFDVAAGKPIEKIFGEKAVQFRPTLDQKRTLGEEVIENTFNFAMASAGDSLGRQLIGMVDPNAESKWRGEDGKIKFPKAVKSVTASAFNVFEAQLEDWMVAVPYAFQKRFQRNAIDKFSPGFGHDADRALNGSSFKVDEDGKIKGTFAMEGALDLQARFTGYNIGTLMYRDASKAVKRKIKDMTVGDDGEFEKPKVKLSANPITLARHAVEGVGHFGRYTLKSVIKGTLFMTPSVPVFWGMRTQQNKHQGLALDKDGNPVLDMNGNIAQADGTFSATGGMLNGQNVANPFAQPDFNPYKPTYGKFDAVLNPFGKASFEATRKATGIAGEIADRTGLDKDMATDLTGRYVNGAMAYTPYIYVKNEFSHRWDNQDMDKAIYRAIDGAFSFNWQEMREGVRAIGNTMRMKTPDMTKMHPETIPANYDQDKRSFVTRVGDQRSMDEIVRRHAIKADDAPMSWQDRTAAEASPEVQR